MANLIKEPFTRLNAVKSIETQLTQAEVIRDYSVDIQSVVVVSIWTLLFIYGSFKILQKRDL